MRDLTSRFGRIGHGDTWFKKFLDDGDMKRDDSHKLLPYRVFGEFEITSPGSL